jgi:hypothetical protein
MIKVREPAQCLIDKPIRSSRSYLVIISNEDNRI